MRLAARGARDLDEDGAEEARDVPDHDLADALRRQARRIHAQALILAALATAAFLVFPL